MDINEDIDIFIGSEDKHLKKPKEPDISSFIWNEKNVNAYLDSIKKPDPEDVFLASTHKYFLVAPTVSSIKQADAILSATISYKLGSYNEEMLVKTLTDFEQPAFKITIMQETAPRSGEFKKVIVDFLEAVKEKKDVSMLARLTPYL